jgi:DNA mismatch endonuclease (patch repair protein)
MCADIVSAAVRSAMMSHIRGKNSRPELALRRQLFASGYRFRLHRRDLPGSPDIVLPKHRAVVFVHGCFWHRHEGCPKATTPSSNAAFWRTKFTANVRRDAAAIDQLVVLGWRVAVVWECVIGTGGLDSAQLAKLSAWIDQPVDHAGAEARRYRIDLP